MNREEWLHTAQTAIYGLSMGSIGMSMGIWFTSILALGEDTILPPEWWHTAKATSKVTAAIFLVGMLAVVAVDYQATKDNTVVE